MNNLAVANHLTYQAKINNGSFYTPSQLVNHVWKLITPFLTKNAAILDTSAGKGSFFAPLNGSQWSNEFLNHENKDLFLIAVDNNKRKWLMTTPQWIWLLICLVLGFYCRHWINTGSGQFKRFF